MTVIAIMTDCNGGDGDGNRVSNTDDYHDDNDDSISKRNGRNKGDSDYRKNSMGKSLLPLRSPPSAVCSEKSCLPFLLRGHFD